MENIILMSISKEDLQQIIRDSVKSELNNSTVPSPIIKEEETLMNTKDVQSLFGVSRITIHKWKKQGLFPYHKINRKLYFKRSEVIASMKRISLSK